MEAILQTIRDQGLDPRTIKVLRDTTEKDGFITDRFCFYRYLEEDEMDEVPTSAPLERRDTPLPREMDLVTEAEEDSDNEPQVTTIRRPAFEPLSGTPTTSTPLARSTSENSQRGLSGIFSGRRGRTGSPYRVAKGKSVVKLPPLFPPPTRSNAATPEDVGRLARRMGQAMAILRRDLATSEDEANIAISDLSANDQILAEQLRELQGRLAKGEILNKEEAQEWNVKAIGFEVSVKQAQDKFAALVADRLAQQEERQRRHEQVSEGLHARIGESRDQALQRDLLLEQELKELQDHRDQLVQQLRDQRAVAERLEETIARDGRVSRELGKRQTEDMTQMKVRFEELQAQFAQRPGEPGNGRPPSRTGEETPRGRNPAPRNPTEELAGPAGAGNGGGGNKGPPPPFNFGGNPGGDDGDDSDSSSDGEGPDWRPKEDVCGYKALDLRNETLLLGHGLASTEG